MAHDLTVTKIEEGMDHRLFILANRPDKIKLSKQIFALTQNGVKKVHAITVGDVLYTYGLENITERRPIPK